MKQVNGIGGMSSAHDAIDGLKIVGTVPGITYITSLLWAFQILSYLVCLASLIRSVGGLSKCFYQGLWLADLNADVIGHSISGCGVA